MAKTNYRESRKKSFLLYYNKIEYWEENLSYEQIGKLICSMAKYDMYGELPELNDKLLEFIFNDVKMDLDIAMEKYKYNCVRNKVNRHKGETSSLDEKEMKIYENGQSNGW